MGSEDISLAPLTIPQIYLKDKSLFTPLNMTVGRVKRVKKLTFLIVNGISCMMAHFVRLDEPNNILLK